MDIVEIAVCNGVEGPSVYINDYRVAGNKPWGGGKTIHSFKAEKSNIFHALKIEQSLKEKDDEIERLRIALNKIVEVEGWPNRKGKDSPMARIAVEALGEHVKRFCF